MTENLKKKLINFLQIEDINLVRDRDFILVRDGNHPKSPLLANLTGDKKNNPRIVMSTVSDLYLYFKTSLGETKKGFKIKYSQGKAKDIFLKREPGFKLSSKVVSTMEPFGFR